MAALVIGVVGSFVGILTVGQSLAILTFGLPTARQWFRDGRFADARPLQRYRKSLVLLATVLAASVAGVLALYSEHLVAFGVGLGLGIISSTGGLRKKDDLFADFLQVNASSIQAPKDLQEACLRLGVSLPEVAAAPERTMHVLEDFSKLIEDTPCQVRPESALPYPRPVIEEALQKALSTFSDPERRKLYEMPFPNLTPSSPTRTCRTIRRHVLWSTSIVE